MKSIIVLGSINMDLVVSAQRAPEAGETLSGSSFQTIPGGKGANQAVAMARQGGQVFMIAKVGADAFGEDLIGKLAENQVKIDHIKRDASTSSGVALIVVEKNGQNRILVVAGANGQVKPADVDQAGDLFNHADFLATQFEIPKETVKYALSKAKSMNIKTVLNAAPAPTDPLDDGFLQLIDYLVVNETEAQTLSALPVKDQDSAAEAARVLQKRSGGVVVLTMGDQGTLIAAQEECWHTPAFQVEVKDTTAAGDAFIGGLITQLQKGCSLKEAVIHANAAGALAVGKFGAQPSLPVYDETIAFLSSRKLK